MFLHAFRYAASPELARARIFLAVTIQMLQHLLLKITTDHLTPEEVCQNTRKNSASDFSASGQYTKVEISRMLAPALRVQELTFRESIATYVTAKCRQFDVRRVNVEDLVQEALTEIVASIASFRQEKGDFDKWGRGVALNVIRRHVRDTKRYSERFSEYHPNVEEHPAPAPSPERCVQQSRARCSLSRAAQDLTDQQAEILLLHVVDGLSHKEIGSELEITEEASLFIPALESIRAISCGAPGQDSVGLHSCNVSA